MQTVSNILAGIDWSDVGDFVEIVSVAVAAVSGALAAKYARQSQMALQGSRQVDRVQEYYGRYTAEPAAREIQDFTADSQEIFSRAIEAVKLARAQDKPAEEVKRVALSAIGEYQRRQSAMKDVVLPCAEIAGNELYEQLRGRIHTLENELIESLPLLEADPDRSKAVRLIQGARVDLLRELMRHDPGMRTPEAPRSTWRLWSRTRAAFNAFRSGGAPVQGNTSLPSDR